MDIILNAGDNNPPDNASAMKASVDDDLFQFIELVKEEQFDEAKNLFEGKSSTRDISHKSLATMANEKSALDQTQQRQFGDFVRQDVLEVTEIFYLV